MNETERQIVEWLDSRIAKMNGDLTAANAPYIAQAIAEIRRTTKGIRDAIISGEHKEKPDEH
jgi:hypothetical protein